MLGASLFPRLPHHLPALSRLPSLPLSRLFSRCCIPCLTFPRRSSPYTLARRIQRRGIQSHIDVQCECECRYNARKRCVYNTYICIHAFCTCREWKFISFLLVHPICRSIDLSVGLYRASLHDDKFQLTLINFLLCRRRSNFCHVEAWYDKVIHTHTRIYTHLYIQNTNLHYVCTSILYEIYIYIYIYSKYSI